MKYVRYSSDSLVSDKNQLFPKRFKNDGETASQSMSNEKWQIPLDILQYTLNIQNLGKTIWTRTSNESI